MLLLSIFYFTVLSYSLSLVFLFLSSLWWSVQTCSSPLSITSLSQVHWSRKRSLLNPNKILDERQFLSFPGKRTHAIVPGLKPFSEYSLTVNVFNKKGNGPNSDQFTFNTPEGGEVTQTYNTQYMDGCSSHAYKTKTKTHTSLQKNTFMTWWTFKATQATRILTKAHISFTLKSPSTQICFAYCCYCYFTWIFVLRCAE